MPLQYRAEPKSYVVLAPGRVPAWLPGLSSQNSVRVLLQQLHLCCERPFLEHALDCFMARASVTLLCAAVYSPALLWSP